MTGLPLGHQHAVHHVCLQYTTEDSVDAGDPLLSLGWLLGHPAWGRLRRSGALWSGVFGTLVGYESAWPVTGPGIRAWTPVYLKSLPIKLNRM